MTDNKNANKSVLTESKVNTPKSNNNNNNNDSENSTRSSSPPSSSSNYEEYVPPSLRNRSQPRNGLGYSGGNFSNHGSSKSSFGYTNNTNTNTNTNTTTSTSTTTATNNSSSSTSSPKWGSNKLSKSQDPEQTRERSSYGNYNNKKSGYYGYNSSRNDRRFGNSRFSEPDPFAEEEAIFSGGINTGINFDKYDDIPVETSGEDVPEPVNSFSEGNLGPLIEENIRRAKYTKPTPVQKHSIPIIAAGRDLMACAQTGSGKTAAFLLPVISKIFEEGVPSPPVAHSRQEYYEMRSKARPVCLVLAPTRELAKQINKEAKKFSYTSKISSVCVYGGADFGKQLYNLERGSDILVATPGRLQEMLERGKVTLECVRYLVLDEADRMLDMGFEPAIRLIVEKMDMPASTERQTMMFSATWPPNIQKLAADFLNDWIFLTVGQVGSTTDFICQKVMYVPEEEKPKTLLELLKTVKGLTLVFVSTKKGADILDNLLYDEGLPSTSIHGDRTQRERENALMNFKCGRLPILVATDVAARGLDIPNVLHVINYDMPNNIESYIHRIGRTGRAGNSGLATGFINEENLNVISDLVDCLKQHDQEVPDWIIRLDKRSKYSNSSSNYYGRSPGAGRFNKKNGNNNYGRFGGRDFRNKDRDGRDRFSNSTGSGKNSGSSSARSSPYYSNRDSNRDSGNYYGRDRDNNRESNRDSNVPGYGAGYGGSY